jgi:hypothetical protein
MYRSTLWAREMMATMAPDQGKAEMARWMAWGGAAGPALVDWGAPLGEAATVGGSANAGFITGYSIVSADNMENARKLFEAHPHLGAPGAAIDVIEMMPLPGQH